MYKTHMTLTSSKNDLHFFLLPQLDVNFDTDSQLHILSKLKDALTGLNERKREYTMRLKGVTQTKPQLLLEIQKGKDLHVRWVCQSCEGLKTFVQLVPGGPVYGTMLSDLIIPFWYELFALDAENAETVRVIVVSESCGSLQEVGRCEFSLQTLSDQEVLEGWFPLSGKVLAGLPCLRLRLQLITNERSLITRLLEQVDWQIVCVQSQMQAIESTAGP